MLSELKEVKHQIVDNKVRAPVCFKKTNYVCVPGGKKCSFLGKFDVFCFLETPVLRFTLLPYYQQNDLKKNCVSTHQEIMVCYIDVSAIL